MSGEFVSCQSPGWVVLANSSTGMVQALQVTIGETNGTAISEAEITLKAAGTPINIKAQGSTPALSTANYTLNDEKFATVDGSFVVHITRVDTTWGVFLNVGVILTDIESGVLVDGCPDQAVDYGDIQVPEECTDITDPALQYACSVDLMLTGDPSFAMMSIQAQRFTSAATGLTIGSIYTLLSVLWFIAA
jgi:hypothetical protein